MQDVYRRAITGVVIVIIITSCVLYSVYSFLLLCLSINILGLREFYTLFSYTNNTIRKLPGLLLSVFLQLSTCFWIYQKLESEIFLILTPLVAFIFISELYLKSPTPFVNLAFIFLGIIYVTVPCILLFVWGLAYTLVNAQTVILGYFFLLWANDTGAYSVGSLLGKTPLFARISPKKAWEGSAGGALLVMIIAYINSLLFQELSFIDWVSLGGIVIIFGTYGDLVKSLMKRSLHKKDSGNILPGHGGILDRFDSLLGSVPWIYAYSVLVK